MSKDDKRDFIMFEGEGQPAFGISLRSWRVLLTFTKCPTGAAGQQEYDWERSINIKMKEQVIAFLSKLLKVLFGEDSKDPQPTQSTHSLTIFSHQEQMRRREVHMKESLERVSQALHRRWRRQRDRLLCVLRSDGIRADFS